MAFSEIYIIIVAGGSGTRMRTSTPKQFLPLCGEPVLFHPIRKFSVFTPDAKLLLVLPEEHFETWKELCDKHRFTLAVKLIKGGTERFYSVSNALKEVPHGALVAVHDGVRPLFSKETFFNTLEAAEKHGAAIPVVSVRETLRRVQENKSETVNRSEYKLVQTPQCFDSSLLKKAYQQGFSNHFTDDASVVEALGHAVLLVDGNTENIKITEPNDLLLAEVILKTYNNQSL